MSQRRPTSVHAARPAHPAPTGGALAVSPRAHTTLVEVLRTGAPGVSRDSVAAAVVADSIGAKLVTAPLALVGGSEMAVSLLNSFLDEERKFLLPPPTLDRTPLPHETHEAFTERARLIDDLRAGSSAENTRRSYYGAVVAWRDWCEDADLPPLPLDPARVADHLFDYAFELDTATGSYRRDDEGHLQARVVATTVGIRLTGLNKLAEYVGIARPGDNQGVQEMMSGLRRMLGTAPLLRKDALTDDLLPQCLQTLSKGSYMEVRDRALVLLRAHARVSLGQAASLQWADVVLEDGQVHLTLAPTHKHGRARTVTIGQHRNPRLCLVRVLRDLEALAPAPLQHVFVRPARTTKGGRRIPPQPVKRQTLSDAIRRVAGDVGDWKVLPDATPAQLARALDDGPPRTPLPAQRDAALLLIGFWTAQRRRDLAALNWGDITDRGTRGIEVLFRKTKTDQEGRGHRVGVAASPDPEALPCPVTALRRWRQAVTEALGRPPADDEPVFVALTSNAGTVEFTTEARARPRRLSGPSINDVVQRIVVAAGLATKVEGQRLPFGAHSLRAGFITSARRARMTDEQIMRVTGHDDPRTLATYTRERDVLFNSPGAQMMSALSGRSSR